LRAPGDMAAGGEVNMSNEGYDLQEFVNLVLSAPEFKQRVEEIVASAFERVTSGLALTPTRDMSEGS
jgi:hypothetical protein